MSVCESKLGPRRAIPVITRGSCTGIWFTPVAWRPAAQSKPRYKGSLWSQRSLETHSICRRADCTSLGLLSHFPSSYSNDPILIHTGTSSNWCQVSDFYIHQRSTSNKPWRASQPHGEERPGVCLRLQGRAGVGGSRVTCLIGMARPLPMLSARLSRPFFSLSGSLPFRDWKAKIKLTFGEGLRFTDFGGESHLRGFCKIHTWRSPARAVRVPPCTSCACVYPHGWAVRVPLCTSCACTHMGELCVYPRVPAVCVPTCTSCGCTPMYQLCVYPLVRAVRVPTCTSWASTHVYQLWVYPRVPAVCVPIYELSVYPHVPAVCTPMYKLCMYPHVWATCVRTCTSSVCTHMDKLGAYPCACTHIPRTDCWASIATKPSHYREFSKLSFPLFHCKIIF